MASSQGFALPSDVSGNLTAQQVIGILEAIQQINTEASLDGQLARIATVTSDLARCERCTVFLLDPERHELCSRVATGLTDQEVRVPVGRGVAGAVAETGALENIPDAYADPRFHRDVDTQTGFRTRNLLVVPITSRQGQTLGVLQLINKVEGRFTGADEALLTVFAAQVATAIQNVQRLEEFRATDAHLKQAFRAAEAQALQRSEVRRRRRAVVVGLVAVLLLAAGILGLHRAHIPIPFLASLLARPAQPEAEAPGVAPAGDSVPVGRDSLVAKIVQTGNAEPAVTRAVVAPANGTVVEVLAREGQRVNRDEPLLRLDDRELRTRLQTANANLLRAKGQLQTLVDWARSPEFAQARRSVQLANLAMEENRGRLEVARRLFDHGIASRDEVDSATRTQERLQLELQAAEEGLRAVQGRATEAEQAVLQAQIRSAQAEVDEASRLLAATSLTAPFAGLVMLPEGPEGRRLHLPEPGDQVQPGLPLMLLGDVRQLRVRALLDEVDVDKVRQGQKAVARLDAFPDVPLEGQVVFISPVARIVDKVPFFEIVVGLAPLPPAIRDRVRLGMSATVEIATVNRPNVLTVPIQAVIRDGTATYVERIVRPARPGQAPGRERIRITLGAATTNLVEVVEGLQEGDEIALP